MNIQLKKGVLELCVLASLHKTDRYGYELVEMISGNVDIAEGTIYPLLKRLLDDGFCDSYLRESPTGPPRKYYRLTDRGKVEVKRLASEWNVLVKGVNKILEGDRA
jgi:PadR family transcriptional regulator, regulatory protein PadR